MRYTKGLLLILLSIVITSCNLNEYQKLQLDKNKYYFSFDQEVPNNFQLIFNLVLLAFVIYMFFYFLI